MRQVSLKPYYDLVIIGGGIQGCAMLREAQSRGLDSLLVERGDYCAQTSANSLKTIHGGIRYLQSLDLARTVRSVREQESLLRIAPHLVRPLTCLMPTGTGLKHSRAAVISGFALYNLLKRLTCAGGRLSPARYLSREVLQELTGQLDRDGVTGAGLWHDAQVQHTERLGLEFVHSACRQGASAWNYLAVRSIRNNPDRSQDIDLQDMLDSRLHTTRADAVICCTAAGTAELLSQSGAGDAVLPPFCLAVNLVVSNVFSEYALGLKSGFATGSSGESSRLLFAAPWHEKMLYGTWYFEMDTAKASPRPSAEQVRHCLEDVNATFPGVRLEMADIGRVHAGLLPTKRPGENPGDLLMENNVITRPDPARSLITVIPTKYTTCRAVAEQVINRLGEILGQPVAESRTANTVLDCGKQVRNIKSFTIQCQERYGELFAPEVYGQLAQTYGNGIENIAALCRSRPELAALIPGTDDHVQAQLEYALESEQVCTLADFVCRRTCLGAARLPERATLEYCAKRIAVSRDPGPGVSEQIRHLHETVQFPESALVQQLTE